jgi:DNA-binding NarL/FixJ family response regulator
MNGDTVDNLDINDLLTKARARAMRALRDDDAAQAVVVSLWKAIAAGQLKAPEQVNAYLRASINNQKNELLRHAYTSNVEFDENVVGIYVDDSDEPARDYSQLGTDEKHVVEKLIEGHSVTEIAEQLGCHRATIYRQIERLCDKMAA